MHRRHFLGFSVAAVMAATGISGCGRSQPLRMGIHPWIGYEPLYLAEEFGWLSESVTLFKGEAAADSMAGLLSGALDGAALTLDEMLRVKDQGGDPVVVGVTDVSAGADALIVQPSIRELPELKGKRVAAELAGVSGILLIKILERAGLSRDDIVQVDLPVNEHVDAWRRGQVDASVCYEPVASILQRQGGVRLFDSGDLPETIFDVLVVNRETAENNPRAVRDLLNAHFAGLRHLVRNLHDSVYRVASRQNTSPAAIRQALATVMLPDLAANQRYMASTGRIEYIARSLGHIMTSEGMISRMPDSRRLCDPSFLPRSVI
ncbi:ABC transporter substrate-binding protein [Marinobacter sp. M216]|uniref:ABC transporter substrate-binding protein n=1 Tax=Marinobacter albus TaxID=3030833 RepID=A0ABT7H8B1_9GAMM|nr:MULTISPECIES: ABC transporter substrate-binding protein [unclassified Marinobacter]MBW7471458.1 ABC transporter substrate-binding protein [Marinobacter sp. F4218]MDK9556264.1 ABC transporter substrate-binding protein [Marinobacter sp. M216]